LAVWPGEYSPIEEVFALTLAVGLLVVAAVALSPGYVARVRLPRRSTALGAAFVVAALLFALPTTLWHLALLPSRNEVFLVSFVLLLLGALLIVGSEPEDDPGADDDEPPWWPSFELDFRSYARSRRPLVPSGKR
jgi:drug/metabolite transporter (DMT)-like permease